MRETRLAVILSAAVVALACGSAPSSSRTSTPAPSGPPPEVTPERIAEGKQLYEKGVCIQCHGLNGSGTQNGPALNDANWIHGRGNFGQIMNIIINGVSASDILDGYRIAMPARGQNVRTGDPTLMTNDQITSIAAYIYSISRPR